MTPTAFSGNLGVAALIMSAGPVVKFVLSLLFLLSIICWAIIFYKGRNIRRARMMSSDFFDVFWESKKLDAVSMAIKGFENAPSARIFKAGYLEAMKAARSPTDKDAPFSAVGIEMVERALRKAEGMEMAVLEKHLNFLATTGSAAPFIGLFGTVWGIMNSFQQIGAMGTANLAVVAPGVSEALIATAVGLAAAIPAVIFYNIFVDKIRQLSQDFDNMILEFLNIAERGLRIKKRDENN